MEVKKLVKKSGMNQTDYIRHAIFNKEIIVINDLTRVQKELNAIGKNLNQLTKKANSGAYKVVYLDETVKLLGTIHEDISLLCERVSKPTDVFVEDTQKITTEEVQVEKQEVRITEEEVSSTEPIIHEKTTTTIFGERKPNSMFGHLRGGADHRNS